MTRAEEEKDAERALKRNMSVDRLEELVRRFAPGYDGTDDRHYIEDAVDALIEAAR